jgi:hypothetical protein
MGKMKLWTVDCVPFLVGVWRRNVQLLAKKLTPRVDYKMNICDFHEHADEDEKKVCKKKSKQAKRVDECKRNQPSDSDSE